MEALANIYAGQAFWIWGALAAVLLSAEVVTGSGWLLWASAAAAVTAGLVALLDVSAPTALLAFAILTMASTLMARRYFPRHAVGMGDDINDNVSRLVGHHGVVVGVFANGAGRVFIDGKEWAAQLDDEQGMDAGASVLVTGVDGARLRVRRA